MVRRHCCPAREEIQKDSTFLIPEDCNYYFSSWWCPLEILLPVGMLPGAIPLIFVGIWVQNDASRFPSLDMLPQEAHISRVILGQKFRDNCFLFLCASVSICGTKWAQVLEHPRSSVLINTLPWPRDRVEHNLSLMQWLYQHGRCCKSWLLCKCNHSSSYSFFSPCYPSSKCTYIHSSFTVQPEQMACWLFTFNNKNSLTLNCCNHMSFSAILE